MYEVSVSRMTGRRVVKIEGANTGGSKPAWTRCVGIAYARPEVDSHVTVGQAGSLRPPGHSSYAVIFHSLPLTSLKRDEGSVRSDTQTSPIVGSRQALESIHHGNHRARAEKP